jgi:hypothetical protein
MLKIAVGIGLVGLGIVWILQGLNLFGGSFMTGDRHWVVYDAIVTLFGLLMLASNNLRRPGRW